MTIVDKNIDKRRLLGINVETWLLVAVWKNPFIFQGCFKITVLNENDQVLFFFRCQAVHHQPMDILHHQFSPDQYEFTHLYNEWGIVLLEHLSAAEEDAVYLLKYALHKTLEKMLSSSALRFTSVDDIAMQTLINQVKPILNKEISLSKELCEEGDIGFAVAMDCCPQEETGLLAIVVLLDQFQNPVLQPIQYH